MAGPAVELSTLDQERFGIETARWASARRQDLTEVLAFCAAHRVELLIARCDSSDLQAVHALEEAGGKLMDTLVYYSRGLNDELPTASAATAGILVRSARAGDAGAVRDVAAAAFRGYMGHYHADLRLDRAKADEVYTDWAFRSCVAKESGDSSNRGSDEVLVAERDDSVVGFLSLHRNDPEEVEIVLNAVSPSSQRQGVYSRLLVEALEWARRQGAGRMLVSTQLINLAAQRAWQLAGFAPAGSLYTFHLWLEPPCYQAGPPDISQSGTPSPPR